jgi:hypothetical protein
MHEVAQRRHFDAPVGVIRENRNPRRRALPTHHPIVAPLSGNLPWGHLSRADSRREPSVGLDHIQCRKPPRPKGIPVARARRIEHVLRDDVDV